MTVAADYLNEAEFALAAYATLPQGNSLSAVAQALLLAGMSTAQAARFASTYTVIDQYNDTNNGLSATVFSDASGNKYLAIRGTDDGYDLATDAINIAALGSTKLQPQYTSLKAKVSQWIGNGTLSSSFTVTGHSLGGFLATGVAADFASNVSHAYLYNSPGLGGILGSVLPFSALRSALGIGATTLDPSKVSNIKAEASISPIAGLGVQVSPTISVVIEDQLVNVPSPPAARNHSQQVLTDALALYAAFAALDANISTPNFNALLKSDSNQNNLTLESGLDALRRLMLGSTISATVAHNRDDFYTNLYALQNSTAYTSIASSGSAQISVLSTLTAGQIKGLASVNTGQGLAVRYALQILNPFALVGIDYSSLNVNGALNLYDASTALNGMTSEYLTDRSSFLERKLWFSSQDKNPVKLLLPVELGHPRFEGDSTFFKDYASGYQIAQGFAPDSPLNSVHHFLFGDGGANTLTGRGVDDSLYGGAGNDVLNGQGGADWLEGNADADKLDGGANDDTLLGGSGADVFVVGLNAGQDTILNPDTTDQLQLVGRTLTGAGTFKSSASGVTVWTDSSQTGTPVTYIHDAVNRELTVVGAGSSVRVRDFDSGELGISVPVAPAPTPAPTAAVTFDLSTAAGRNQWSLSGTLPQTDNWRVFNANSLTTGSVLTAQGDDVIVGGTASVTRQTFLSSGAGHDRIYSGTELTLADAIATGEVQAATGRSVYMLSGDIGDDLLVGAGDDDALFGGKGNDTLIGGSGGDVIFADGNNDYAYSVDGGTGVGAWITGANNALTDEQRKLVLRTIVAVVGTTPSDSTGSSSQGSVGLSIAISPLAETDFSGLLAMLPQNVVPYAGDTRPYIPGSQRTYGDLTGGAWFGTNVGKGNDLIHAGAGDDVVNAGGGDDVVDAGTGNDQVAGYDGNDVIRGGAGNDGLQGDYQSAVTTGDAVENLTYYGASGAIRYTLDASRHGQDIIDGGAGNDLIFGGGGSDLLYGGADNDVIYGDDYKLSSQYAGDDHLDGGDGDDQLVGGGGADELIGGDGADRLEGDDLVADVAATWHGADRLDGGRGDDDLYGGGGDDVLLGGEGNDWLVGEDQLTVTSATTLTGSDSLDGGAGNDTLVGGMGNDTLIGGGGADQLYAGTGNDVLIASGIGSVLDSGADRDLLQVAEGSNITVNVTSASAADADDLMLGGGLTSATVSVAISGGLDPNAQTATLTFAGSATVIRLSTSSATASLGNALNTLQFSDGVTWSATDIRAKLHGSVSDGSDTLIALNGIDDALTGGGGSDSLSGANGGDLLDGGDGDDWMTGRGGSDTMIGGAGADQIQGGEGNDLFIGGTGNDETRDSSTISDDVYRYERGDGYDLIDDYGGNDRLELGAGLSEADVQLFQEGSILQMRLPDSGHQTLGIILGSGAIDTQRFIETIRFANGVEWGVARIKQELLKGTAGADRIYGFETNDSIDGADGNDTIEGMSGDDTLYGSRGNDLLWDVRGNDQLVGGEGNDDLEGGEGNDVLIGGVGDDFLFGGIGNDTFRFGYGDGADTIAAELSGSDSIEFDSSVLSASFSFQQTARALVLSYGATDKITISGAFDGLTGALYRSNVQVIQFADGVSWSGVAIEAEVVRRALATTTGNDTRYLTANSDALDAGDGNDTVYGLGAGDSLSGGNGNDVLYGGIGNDTLQGGAGNDIVEGEDGNDVLQGGDGADTLRGGYDGVDTFDGGAGNDTLDDLTGADIVYFGRGDGQDVVETVTYSTFGVNSTIEFKPGVLPADIVARRVSDGQYQGLTGLELSIRGTTDRILAKSYFNPGTYSVIQQVRFSNGTVWDATRIQQEATASLVDTLVGTAAADTLVGGGGSDAMYGLAGGDMLIGNAGNDTLDGGAGADTMVGGDGDDVYQIDDAGDVLIETASEGWDTVESSISWSLPENIDVLRLQGNGNINATGNSATNFLVGNAGANRLDGRGGLDSLMGGAGDDSYVVDNVSDYIYEYAGGGLDAVESSVHWTLTDEVENLTLTGTAALSGTGNALDNVLTGNSANNKLTGAAGKDTLDGGAGNDTMVGGTGDDVYVVNSSADVVTEAVGEGTDTVRSSITMTLGANLENLTLTGTGALNAMGNALNNLLNGNSANNTLNGGVGADTTFGGAGNDIYVVDLPTDVVIEAANEGTDTVQSAITWALGDSIENLTLTGAAVINGTGNTLNNNITGNTASNMLTGDAGNDTLNGGASSDTLIGGAGNDIYVVDVATDLVIEAASEGTDTVQSAVTWTLGDTLENLTLTGSAAINGTGNALNNSITGNTANNTLTGGAGNDTLNGGAGADTLIGGVGNDAYVVDVATDVVTELAGEGTDTVQSAVTWTLGDTLENLTLTGSSAINGTGNALDNVLNGNAANNTLTGSAGNDTLNGGAGADTLIGGAGNDVYIVDLATDVVIELAGEGSDTVQSSATWTLSDSVENLTMIGTAAINGTGNALNNSLAGNSANNTLTGGAGNDTLNGGSGTDTLIGGAGNDLYFVDVATDVVTELANEGTDSVQSAVTWTLGANLENLTLTGSSVINATGNSLDNALVGNAANNLLTGGAGNDTLNGGAGVDTMIGGAGNDVYTVDVATDVVTELVDEGTDTVQSAVTWTLGSTFENLTLTGSIAINGIGNALDNVLIGNYANNVLTGGAGNDTLSGGGSADTMVGGLGDDTYVVDNTYDVITEAASQGTDTVQSAASWTLGANVENLTLTGSSAINATGNALNNVLIGNGANNRLRGAVGNDTVVGGAGDDTYVVEDGGDVITETLNEGTDTVEASLSLTLGINLENLTLTGSAALNGTGNALGNVLTGNSGANVLAGGEGNDTYIGGLGSDTLSDTWTTSNDIYVWGRAQGADIVTDAGGTDRLDLLAGVTEDQVWLRQIGNNLELSVIGTTDRLTINGWYTSPSNQIESFKLADGQALLASQVQQLVDAMAAFAPPAAGQTTLPANYAAALNPVIAPSWA